MDSCGNISDTRTCGTEYIMFDEVRLGSFFLLLFLCSGMPRVALIKVYLSFL